MFGMDGKRKLQVSLNRSASPIRPSRSSSPTKQPIFSIQTDTHVFKPKAKVNAVAQAKKTPAVVSGRTPVVKNLNVASTATPRARSRSPARSTVSSASQQTRPRSAVTAPKAYNLVNSTKKADQQPKARSALGIGHAGSLRPSHSVPSSPESPLSTSPRDTLLINRQRNGSLLRHSSSQYYTHSSTSVEGPSPNPPVVIRAKISDVTLNGTNYNTSNSNSIPLPPSPSLPPLSLHRRRTPSMSSSLSSTNSHGQEHTYYPITTSTAAANPHRYPTVRSSPPPPARHQAQYRPFTSFTSFDNDSSSSHTRTPSRDQNVLPTLSPPTSTLSYSSRSSISRESSSYHDDDVTSRLRPPPSPSSPLLSRSNSQRSVDDDLSSSDGEMDRMSEDELRGAERAEAKSNRKMADLEIINRSLTATNSSLEATKHRQAKEIRELRRKLRESRLILPPRAYQSLAPVEVADDQEDEADSDTESDLVRGDESYHRVRLLLDSLIETGKRALESKPDDFGTGGGTRVTVLSAEEVKNWRGDEEDDEHGTLRTISPSRVAMPDSSSDDDEGEDETRHFPPPIRITTTSVE